MSNYYDISEYDFGYGPDEGDLDYEPEVRPAAEERRSKRRRKAFVKTGKAILEMQRPHLDADALIARISVRSIHAIKKAVAGRQNARRAA